MDAVYLDPLSVAVGDGCGEALLANLASIPNRDVISVANACRLVRSTSEQLKDMIVNFPPINGWKYQALAGLSLFGLDKIERVSDSVVTQLEQDLTRRNLIMVNMNAGTSLVGRENAARTEYAAAAGSVSQRCAVVSGCAMFFDFTALTTLSNIGSPEVARFAQFVMNCRSEIAVAYGTLANRTKLLTDAMELLRITGNIPELDQIRGTNLEYGFPLRPHLHIHQAAAAAYRRLIL